MLRQVNTKGRLIHTIILRVHSQDEAAGTDALYWRKGKPGLFKYTERARAWTVIDLIINVLIKSKTADFTKFMTAEDNINRQYKTLLDANLSIICFYF